MYIINDIYEESHEPEGTRLEQSIVQTPNHSCCALVLCLTSGCKTKQNITNWKIWNNCCIWSCRLCPLFICWCYVTWCKLGAKLNWFKRWIKEATCLKFSTPDITSFQKRVVETFITNLKNNIASWFHAVVAFTIFNPKIIQDAASEKFKTYYEMSADLLIKHYGTAKTA